MPIGLRLLISVARYGYSVLTAVRAMRSQSMDEACVQELHEIIVVT